jgi:hypothetical protein
VALAHGSTSGTAWASAGQSDNNNKKIFCGGRISYFRDDPCVILGKRNASQNQNLSRREE